MLSKEEITNKILQGDTLDVLKQMPDKSISSVVTSPPYFNLRDYGTASWEGGKDINCDHKIPDYEENCLNPASRQAHIVRYNRESCYKCGAKRIDKQLGMESTPEEYILRLCDMFDEVKRVLRDDGCVFVNIGDTFIKQDLAMIPYKFAIEMQKRGWSIRNLCLDEDTKMFVKTKEGKFLYLSIKDVIPGMEVYTMDRKYKQRLIKIKNVSNNGLQESLKITTKTGRTVICTPDHQFVSKKSYNTGGKYLKIKQIKACDLKIGNCLYINENLHTDIPNVKTYNEGFVVGFYLAEGSYIKRLEKGKIISGTKRVGLQFSCGISDVERGYIEYLKKYNVNIYKYGNSLEIRSRDKELLNLIQSYVIGDTCDKKHLFPEAYTGGREFLKGILEGMMAGDGYEDKKNNRNLIGICHNQMLVDDIQMICRLLGYQTRFNYYKNQYKGIARISIRKEIIQRQNFNFIADPIEKIENVGKRNVYDIEVEPILTSYCGKGKTSKPTIQKNKNIYNNLYFLGNGIWTHNCIWAKPNPTPASVKNRFTVDFEPIFFFVKNKSDYYFEQQIEPLKEISIRRAKSKSTSLKTDSGIHGGMTLKSQNSYFDKINNGEVTGKNKRAVFNVAVNCFHGNHFATFPEKLIIPLIKASVPKEICDKCGKPRKLILDNKKRINQREGAGIKEESKSGKELDPNKKLHSSDFAKNSQLIVYKNLGYSKCDCGVTFTPGLVLDPFMGSGTIGVAAKKLGVNFAGIDLNPEYIKMAEERILNTKVGEDEIKPKRVKKEKVVKITSEVIKTTQKDDFEQLELFPENFIKLEKKCEK